MMLELKSCKKAIMAKTTRQRLGQILTQLVHTLCFSFFVCSEYRLGTLFSGSGQCQDRQGLLLLSVSGSRSVRICISLLPCFLCIVVAVSTRGVHSSVCANSTPRLGWRLNPFLFISFLLFLVSVRFQLSETEITPHVLRRKMLIQGIRCFQNCQKSWRGRLQAVSSEDPKTPQNWPTQEAATRTRVRKVGNQEPPPDLLILRTYQIQTAISVTSYQYPQNKLQILKHFCRKTRCLHDYACQQKKPRKQEVMPHFIFTFPVSSRCTSLGNLFHNLFPER